MLMLLVSHSENHSSESPCKKKSVLLCSVKLFQNILVSGSHCSWYILQDSVLQNPVGKEAWKGLQRTFSWVMASEGPHSHWLVLSRLLTPAGHRALGMHSPHFTESRICALTSGSHINSGNPTSVGLCRICQLAQAWAREALAWMRDQLKCTFSLSGNEAH